MFTVLKILIAVLAFGLIIFVHELGHFLVAKWMGIRVNEFALGMGPRILKFGKGETTYSWRLFPIGGYCAMEGESEESDDPRAFGNKSVWRRILVVVAGAAMNFLLGFVLLIVALGVCVQPAPGETRAAFCTTTVAELPETAPAYQTGLRPGDTILRIDGARAWTDVDLAALMQSDSDGVFEMRVRRTVDGAVKDVTLPAVRFDLATDAATGTRYLKYDFKVMPEYKTVGTVITRAAKLEGTYTVMIWRSLGQLIRGEYGLNELSGPIGTADIMADAAGEAVTGIVEQSSLEGLYSFLMIVVLITVNVGLFNLLPLPALDGGRLLFLLIELVARRPVPPKYENAVHVIGFVLLILLSIVIAFSDIFKMIH
ncbi:MAG: site-2 protease family protein [Clostridia bacterium]|nr:site-2 protease family protein [Clostridia bacterium]